MIQAAVLVDKCIRMIRSLTEGHRCPNTQFNKHASSRWVASELEDEFKDNPNINKGTTQKTWTRRFGVAIPDYNCLSARQLMKNIVEGRHDEGYKVLLDYMRVFKETNLTLYVLSIERMRALVRIHLLRDIRFV